MAKKATGVLLILVLLLGVLGAIYHLYISNRESSFIDRNFRLLALWSHELSNKVDQYKYDFQYRSSVALSKEDKSAECGKPDSQETNPLPQCPENVFPEDPNKKCDCSKNPDDKFKKAFKKEFETLSENYEGQFTLVSVSRKDKTLNSNNTKVVDKRPHITVQLPSKDEASLRLKYSEKRTKCPTVCKDNAFEIINVQADLSISKIISPLIAEQAFDDVFDNIIVFNSKTGKVHFQKDHFLFRIDNIYDIIVRRSDADGFFSVFSRNSASADTWNNEPGSSTRHSLEALLQNPTHRHIAIGESSYEFFTQPVVLPGLSLKPPESLGEPIGAKGTPSTPRPYPTSRGPWSCSAIKNCCVPPILKHSSWPVPCLPCTS